MADDSAAASSPLYGAVPNPAAATAAVELMTDNLPRASDKVNSCGTNRRRSSTLGLVLMPLLELLELLLELLELLLELLLLDELLQKAR